MADLSNYGCLLKSSGSDTSNYQAIAGLVKLSPPSIKNAAIESTNHSSGKYKQKISSNQVEISDIKGSFSFVKANVDQYASYCISGSICNYQLYFVNGETFSFPALVTEFAPGESDAQKPELLTVDLVLTPSGSMVIA